MGAHIRDTQSAMERAGYCMGSEGDPTMIYQSGMMSHQNAIQRAGTTPTQVGATTSPMCAAPHVARTHAHFGAGTPITPAAAMHVGLQCAATPMSAPQFFCGQDLQNGTMMGQNATMTHLRPSAVPASSPTMLQASMPGICQPGSKPGSDAGTPPRSVGVVVVE